MPEFVCPVGLLLLVKVLGLVLLSVERIGVAVSLVEAVGIGAPGVTEDGGRAPTGELEVVDVEELVKPLPTPEDTGLEAEVVPSPGGIEESTILRFESVDVGLVPGKYDKGWINAIPLEYIVA